MPKFAPFEKSMGILPYTSQSSPKNVSTTPLHWTQQNCWSRLCARAQVKGLVNFKKLSHRTHCNPPRPTLDHNSAKKFLVISQRDSKWVLKVCTPKSCNSWVMECWRQWLQWLQQNFQASYQDDDYEDLFLNAFMMDHTGADFETRKRKHESSLSRQKPNLERESQCGQDRIWRTYFCASIVYDDKLFRWKYQMKWTLFLQILESFGAHDSYFLQKQDALGNIGLSSKSAQKLHCTF